MVAPYCILCYARDEDKTISAPCAEVWYRVVLFTSRKMSAATTTANAWVSLAGTLGNTHKIPLTRVNNITFQVQLLPSYRCIALPIARIAIRNSQGSYS